MNPTVIYTARSTLIERLFLSEVTPTALRDSSIGMPSYSKGLSRQDDQSVLLTRGVRNNYQWQILVLSEKEKK